MNQTGSFANIAAALVAAQAEFPSIPRNKEVTVTGQKGSYKFSYAPFEDILRAVKPALIKHGLGFCQSAEGDKLSTLILHKSGEWLEFEVGIVNPSGTAQSYGSALTYSRRYGFCAAFGIQADDDDDANAADGNTIAHAQHKPAIREEDAIYPPTKEEAFNLLPKKQQEFLRELAASVTALVTEDRADDALGLVRAKKLEMAEELGLWFLLGSKERAALKKAGQQADLEKRAAERNKHQQSRPEQRIPQ